MERGERTRGLQMLQYVGLDDGDEVESGLQSLTGRLQSRPGGGSRGASAEASPSSSPFASPARRAAGLTGPPSRGSPDAALVEGLLATGSPDVLRSFERSQDGGWSAALGTRGGGLPGLLRRAALAGEPLSPGDTVAIHAARVSREHFLEAAVEAALAEVVDGRLEVAKTLLRPCPQLQPLAAVLAWDAVATPAGGLAKADVLPARKRILQVLGESAAVQLGASEQIMLHTCRDLAYGLQVAESLVVPGGDFRQASDGELRASGRLVRSLGKGSVLKALSEELPGLDPKLVAGVVAERPAQPGTRDGLWRDHDVDVAHVWAVLRLSISALMRLGAGPGALAAVGGRGAPPCAPAGIQGDRGQLSLHISGISCPFLRCYTMNVLVAFLSIDWGAEGAVGEEEEGGGARGGEVGASPLEVLGGFLLAIKDGLPRGQEPPSEATVAGLHEKLHRAGSDLPPDAVSSALAEVLRALQKNTAAFLHEAEWRFGMLRTLQERGQQPGVPWTWDKVMATLHCTGQMFLSLCQQHCPDPELCDAVIAHFNLSDADTASYQVSEWMQDWVSRSSVEDMISHISSEKTSETPTSSHDVQSSDGATTVTTATSMDADAAVCVEEDFDTSAHTVSLDLFHSLKLGPVDKAMLCIDIASAAAGSPDSSRALVAKAEEFLMEAPRILSGAPSSPGDERALSSDAYLVSQSRHMIKYLRTLLDIKQDSGKSFRRSFLGVKPASSTACALAADLPASHLKALSTLEEAINAAATGKRQFLSGLLHNLARVLGEGEAGAGEGGEEPFWAGLRRVGFGPPVTMSPPAPGPSGGGGGSSVRGPQEEAARGAQGGEKVSGVGGSSSNAPPHPPPPPNGGEQKGLRGEAGRGGEERAPPPPSPAASASEPRYISQFISYLVKIGDILSIVDSAETLNYFSVLDRTPRAILLRTIFDRNQPEMASQVAQLLGTDLVHEVLSACVTPVRPPLRQARAGEKSTPWEGFRGQSLKMDVLRYLAERSPVRVALACVYVLMQEGSSGASRDHEALAFALELAGPFPPLKQWVKLQAGIMALSSGGGVLKENDRAEGFLWEDTTAYHGRLKQLAAEGKYVEAIALADCWLPSGAPDWVLHEAAALELNEAVLCEAPPERAAAWASICDKILRLRSTETVAKFVLECAEHLPPGPGLPVLQRCINDLGPGRTREEVAKLLGRLELFKEILMVDPRFNGDSVTLAQAYASDAAQLASSLAVAAHHSTALKVCRACVLPGEVWAQVQGSHLANLLLESPSSGGGAATAVQFVRNLDPRHVLQVAEVAMKELRAGQGANLEATLVLVEFLLVEYGPSGSGSAEMSARQRAFLTRTQTGLKGLAELPSAWQARCRHLVRSPELLVETLLMNHQVHLVKAVRRGGGAPGLCNDAMVAMYAERSMARALCLNYPAGLGYRTGPIETPSLRRARATAGSSAVFCSFDLDAEGGVGGALSSEASSNGFFILTGDQALDMELRTSHSFACAPSAVLFQSIMSLASSRVVAAQVGTSILKNAAENLLPSVSGAEQGSSSSRAGRGGSGATRSPVRVEFAAVSAAAELVDALDATEAMLPRLGNSAEDAAREESAGSSPRKDSPERGAGGAPGAVQQCRERLSVLRADIEMILTLLSADVPVGFSELQSLGALEKLVDRLTEGENYNLAIFVCSRYAMSPSRVWLLWGCELIRAGVFAEARLRIARAAPPPLPQAGSASQDAQLPGSAAGETGRAGRGFLRGKVIAEAALEALENSGGAPEPPELQALASQIERMALSRHSGALSADTFLSLLGTSGKRLASPSSSSRRGGSPARSLSGPAPSAASRKAARDLARAEEAKYYLATYDPGRLVAYLFRHKRPQEAFVELAGQTEALLARAIVVHAVEAEEGPALVAFLERALRQDLPRLSEGVLRGALQAFRDTDSLEELFHLQLIIPGFLGRAGETCRELLGACRPAVAVSHLQMLRDSCEEFLNDEGGEQGVSPLRGRTGGQALSLLPGAGVRTHEVLRLNREVRLQLDVLGALPSKFLGGGGESSGGGSSFPQTPAWNILTAGADLEDRRVLATAELAPHNFEVAYCVLQEFRLEMRSVCLRAMRSLLADLAATRGGSFEGRLTYLMRNVRATSTSSAFDEVALAAVQMISEQPAGRVPNSAGKWLVKQLSCAHSRTIGWLGLGKISRALESALEEEGGGTLADLQLVAANARMHSDLQTLRKCTEAIEHHSGSRQ